MIDTGVIHVGDCLELMRGWPDGCVDCCVTSPPYYGLRDYGTGTWVGGDAECDHKVGALCSDKSTLAGYTSENIKLRTNAMPAKDTCPKCGATRIDQQLGLEPTMQGYIDKLVLVFREVRRVLKPEGTCWLNIGDSYAGSGEKHAAGKECIAQPNRPPVSGNLKPKDLCMIPARVALALQADGWYLRSDIIWAKPNPMPESVTDRPTSSYEHIFLLTKQARYWYDADAIAERVGEPTRRAATFRNGGDYTGGNSYNNSRKKEKDSHGDGDLLLTGRNARNVWTIATKPYKDAHFATFPPELPRRCILAGCPTGGTVLEPFCGSGTVGMVAEQLGRQWVGIELSPEYAEMARKRTAQRGLFTSQ